jgi:hypothetical protein
VVEGAGKYYVVVPTAVFARAESDGAVVVVDEAAQYK